MTVSFQLIVIVIVELSIIIEHRYLSNFRKFSKLISRWISEVAMIENSYYSKYVKYKISSFKSHDFEVQSKVESEEEFRNFIVRNEVLVLNFNRIILSGLPSRLILLNYILRFIIALYPFFLIYIFAKSAIPANNFVLIGHAIVVITIIGVYFQEVTTSELVSVWTLKVYLNIFHKSVKKYWENPFDNGVSSWSKNKVLATIKELSKIYELNEEKPTKSRGEKDRTYEYPFNHKLYFKKLWLGSLN
jgi:hypothetical protein